MENKLEFEIYEKYKKAYDGEVQGCCLLIADEILKNIGGEIVAGYLTWYGGSCRRSHWWVEKDNQIIDPMGDEFLKYEDYPGRKEVHRNLDIFRKNLLNYEQWRK